MRVRLDSIQLIGTTREVAFYPGLNIITGPIASGKTTLARLCHGLLGSGLENYPLEVRDNVVAIAGQVALGQSTYSIVRPFTTSKTAKVDISGLESALRLPALALDATASYTYGQWLLRTLGLPDLRVPSAPTRPDSDPSPLSINDFFLCCVLSQETIDNSVCGHRDTFKNIKRKYVFEVLYGIYDAEVYWVQERLHEVNTELNGLAAQAGSFQSLLKGAPWENRAELLEQLRVARENLSAIETRAVNSEESNLISDDIQILRSEVLRIDAQLADNRVALEREFSSIDQLKRLIKQLESQSKRLTKTIVARTYLTDFEFILCPRCGADIDEERGATDVCSLCLQVPAPKLDKKDFISEQDRVTAQIQETEELLDAHSRSTTLYERKLSDLSEARERAAHELDFKTQTYVSDRATAITNAATERPAAVSLVRRLEDYLKLFEKLDEISTGRNSLETQKNDLEGTLETLKTRRDVSEQRIRKFEENLNASESFRWMVRTISYALTNCGASAVSAPVRCSFCSTKPRFRPSVVGVARRWRTLHC